VNRSGDGWDGYIEGVSPLQGCGRVDGLPWYFRARWASWSFEVVNDLTVDPELLPMIGTPGVTGWLIEEEWGSLTEASYMAPDVGWLIVERCIERHRRGQLQWVTAPPIAK
jgi:hypothetical protein